MVGYSKKTQSGSVNKWSPYGSDKLFRTTARIKPGKPTSTNPRVYLQFLKDAPIPSVSSVQTLERPGDLIKQGRDVKKSTTTLDFMDY